MNYMENMHLWGLFLDLVLPRICNYEIAPKHRLGFCKKRGVKEKNNGNCR